MHIFGLCLLSNKKWVSRIDTLLEADFKSLTTYFRFEFHMHNAFLVEDGLEAKMLPSISHCHPGPLLPTFGTPR